MRESSETRQEMLTSKAVLACRSVYVKTSDLYVICMWVADLHQNACGTTLHNQISTFKTEYIWSTDPLKNIWKRRMKQKWEL